MALVRQWIAAMPDPSQTNKPAARHGSVIPCRPPTDILQLSLKARATVFQGFPCVNSPVENKPASRRFNLGDSLILIAACALIIAQLRATPWFERFPLRVRFWAETLSGNLEMTSWDFSTWWLWLSHGRGRMVVQQVAFESFLFLCPVLTVLTLVQPLMRLRAPRPPFRDLARQSGLVACLAVIGGTFIFVDLRWLAIIGNSSVLVQAAFLLLLWPLLGLPPWKAERSWIDCLGRGVGWGWIVATRA